MTQAEWMHWSGQAAELLAGNRVEVAGHRYTRPAPATYEQQWLWDSCFHAIIYRWLDPAMARDELLSVVAHQVEAGPDAGMIPHMAYWRGGGEDLWGEPGRSIITQPPLVAVAARLVHDVTRDSGLVAALYPRLCACHEWFDWRRDPDGDGLVSIIHPWESGWDSSPRWDRAMGLASPTDAQARAARIALVERLREHECDAGALARAGLFHVEPVDLNAIRAADLEALAALANVLGRPGEAAHWQGRAEAVQSAVGRKMMGERAYDLESAGETPIEEESAAGYVMLFGGCASQAQAGRLVAQLSQPADWPTFPVPTTPVTAPSFSPRRYWRGNAWLNVNWLIYTGLRRYGYQEQASRLAAASLQLVQQSGFWEYYHPLTGEGLGSHPHSWSALVLDMLATERQSCVPAR